MKCANIVVVSAVFAMALVCPNYSVAGTKTVSGKNTASAVRSNTAGKSGKMATQSNRRTPNRATEWGILAKTYPF